ncbi:MAG: hypothetical protein ACE5KA_06410 [Nitrososphaerales archaeon]
MYKAILASIIILFSIFSNYDVLAAPLADIIDTYGYLDESGHYLVIGEVENVGSTPLHFVEVIVTFFKEELQQLSVTTALETIHPKQSSPFIVTLKDTLDAPLVSSYDARIGNVAPTEYKETKLSVIFHKLETIENNIVISGRIVNDGSALSANTRAMVVLYDIVGNPVRFSTVFTDPRDVLPFASALFSTTIQFDNPINISGYAISSESSSYAETTRLIQGGDTLLQPVQEVANISDLLTLDMKNRAVAAIKAEDPVLVKLNITNILAETRGYTYILQVIDQNGFVSSLSWSMGTLTPSESSTAVIAWVPKEPGRYLLQVFVWKSIEDPTPLAFRTISTNFQVK